MINFNENQKRFLGVGFSGNECILVAVDLAGKVVEEEHIEIKPLPALKGRIKEMKEICKAPENHDDTVRLQAAVEEDRNRLQRLLDRLNWLEQMWGSQGDPKVIEVRKLLSISSTVILSK